jgi:hypothetical protein
VFDYIVFVDSEFDYIVSVDTVLTKLCDGDTDTIFDNIVFFTASDDTVFGDIVFRDNVLGDDCV